MLIMVLIVIELRDRSAKAILIGRSELLLDVDVGCECSEN